jgi:hypothetical protein
METQWFTSHLSKVTARPASGPFRLTSAVVITTEMQTLYPFWRLSDRRLVERSPMIPSHRNTKTIDADLLRIVSQLDLPSPSREALLERFAQSIELAKAGEECISLENLCDNLFEFDVGISKEARDDLADLCLAYGVGSKRVGLLDALVIRSGGRGDG